MIEKMASLPESGMEVASCKPDQDGDGKVRRLAHHAASLVKVRDQREPEEVTGLERLEAYTAGAGSGTSGGWAVVLRGDNLQNEMSGVGWSNGDQMKILALTMALRAVPERCWVTLYTSSPKIAEALVDGSLEAWPAAESRYLGKPVKHARVWQSLLAELDRHVVDIATVKSNRQPMKRAAELARAQADAEKERWAEQVRQWSATAGTATRSRSPSGSLYPAPRDGRGRPRWRWPHRR